MINVVCNGRNGTSFTVPIDDKAFPNFEKAMWDGEKILVWYRGPYDPQSKPITVFGWSRKPFGDCCGADVVTDFSYRVYNNFGLKDSRTPIDSEKAARYQPFWEPWYKEVVREGHNPAIAIIPSNITPKNEIVERSEFYSWLKSKGKMLGQWKNPIYQDSILSAYVFSFNDRPFDIKWGIIR